MVKTIQTTSYLPIPKGVKVTASARVVKVTGPRGKLERDFKPLPVDIVVEGKRVRIEVWFGNSAHVAAVKTVQSHIQNMFQGLVKGFQYNMRLVYAHFPINTAILEDGKLLEIRNFLGQKVVRRVRMHEGVTISRSDKIKDQLELRANNIENIGLAAAVIHQRCAVKEKDIRKFLDGIYVSQKGLIGDFDNQ